MFQNKKGLSDYGMSSGPLPSSLSAFRETKKRKDNFKVTFMKLGFQITCDKKKRR
jgi:hypothetical protein